MVKSKRNRQIDKRKFFCVFLKVLSFLTKIRPTKMFLSFLMQNYCVKSLKIKLHEGFLNFDTFSLFRSQVLPMDFHKFVILQETILSTKQNLGRQHLTLGR